MGQVGVIILEHVKKEKLVRVSWSAILSVAWVL